MSFDTNHVTKQTAQPGVATPPYPVLYTLAQMSPTGVTVEPNPFLPDPYVFLPAPAAPVPTTATTGGTVAAGTYPVSVTYVNALGETVGSANGPITTTGSTSTITVPSPAAQVGATGWYAYVGQAAGAAGSGTRQQAAPTAIGTGLTLTAPPTSTGAALPSANTSLNDPFYFAEN